MKKSIKRTILITAAVMLIVSYVIPAAMASDVPQVVIEAKESVVRVLAMFDDNMIYGHGTAFVIAQDGGTTYLVTNRHVVTFESSPDIPQELWGHRIPKIKIVLTDTDGTLLDAESIFLANQFDESMDLAILKVSGGLSNRPVLPLAGSDILKDGMGVYALGFPGTSDILDDARELYPSRVSDVTLTSGAISKVNVQINGRDYIQHHAVLSGGNSGGPLVNKDGAVIGVNTRGVASANANGAIHIDYVIEACKEMGIPYVEFKSGIDLRLILVIIGAVVLIACAVLIIVMMRGRTAVPAGAAAGPAAPGGFGPQAYPQPYNAQAGGVISNLVCTNGHFAGSTFPLNGRLTIGRDGKMAQIVFPGDTKGISSRHCSVQPMGGTATLTDLGSSYGTFLSNGGRKLGANESVTLYPGDSFYLADRNNEFKVI